MADNPMNYLPYKIICVKIFITRTPQRQRAIGVFQPFFALFSYPYYMDFDSYFEYQCGLVPF